MIQLLQPSVLSLLHNTGATGLRNSGSLLEIRRCISDIEWPMASLRIRLRSLTELDRCFWRHTQEHARNKIITVAIHRGAQ